MGLWHFSKTSWKHLRRKYPPPDTALSHFPQVNEGWNFTIFPKLYQLWYGFFFFKDFNPLWTGCHLLIFAYSICNKLSWLEQRRPLYGVIAR